MQKNKEISHSVISTIAISTLFVVLFMLSASQLSQQASAIHEGNATTTVQRQTIGGNATTTSSSSRDQTVAPDTTTTQNQAAAGGRATETDATTTQTQTPTAATQEPPMNQNFVRQGTVASSHGQIVGTENLAFILPPRNDGGVYS